VSLISKITNPSTSNPGANQIAGLQYDGAGNVTYDNTNSYLYDGEGRICAVASPGAASGIVWTGYIYDADGTRVAKGSLSKFTCDFNPADASYNGFQTIKDYVIGAGGAQMTEVGLDANGALVAQRNYVYAGGPWPRCRG